MRTPLIKLFILTLVLLSFGQTALAAKTDQPGYVDLEFIDIPNDADQIQDIDLGPVLKDVISKAKENDDPEIAELLTMVHHLRMRAYSLDKYSVKGAEEAVEVIARRLKQDDWDNLMKFKDEDELTTISTKYHNDNMVGLMVVVFSPDEEVMFINIVGDLDLGKLMSLAGELDTDELEEYLEQVESSSGIDLD